MVRRILVVTACLVGIALALGPVARAQQAAPAPLPGQPDMKQLATEAQGWLTDLVRMNTTNPPGNEMEAAKYVAAVLQKENISSEVLEVAPGRAVAIGRLQAGPLPDPSKALLLIGHLDVAGADKNKWSVDPFGAVIKDGYLYGRGALDDKGMIVANLATMVALKRSGARLTRDVVFLADDEEGQFGPAGIKVVVDKYWDKIACAYAINEGGRVTLVNGKVQSVSIQASEKVPVNVAVIATGTAGPDSLPRSDNALVHLGAAIAKIGAMEIPVQPTTIVRRYFEQLTPVEDEDTSKWMRALETSERLDLAAHRLADMSPMWNAMLRDSIVPTEFTAGAGSDTVPGEARANLNIRLLPGNPVEPLIAQMQKLVDDPQIRFQVDPNRGPSAPPSSLTSDLYQEIERAAREQFPGAIPVPFLSPRATDSAELRLHNVQAYGVLPFPLTEADEMRMSGNDERIPLASFGTGIEFLYRMVYEFSAAK
jgi:acetylornithine deacetylase/succinyl-diaminopimelate desuccinylase-like protein